MATTNGTQMALVKSTTGEKAHAKDVTGKVRVFRESVALASQAAASIIRVGQLPQGARFLYGILTTTVSLGSTTIKIGTAANDDAMRAAGTFTSANAPTFFGHTDAMALDVTGETDVILTTAAATAPASGTLYVQLFYSVE